MSQKPTLQHSVTKHRPPKKAHLRPDGRSDGVGGQRTETDQVIALSNKHSYIRLRLATKTETGEVIALGNNQITLTNTTPDPEKWIVDARGVTQIMDAHNHPITYGQLTIGSTVTVTSYKANWKQLLGLVIHYVGKRIETETGQVIALTSNQITLTNTTPDPEMWTVKVTPDIQITENDNQIASSELTIGSTATVSSDVGNWTQLA